MEPKSTILPISQHGGASRPDRKSTNRRRVLGLTLGAALASTYILTFHHFLPSRETAHHVPLHAARILEQCAEFKMLPGQPASSANRARSERFVPGTRAQHIYNATIWTGRRDGTDVIYGDVFLEDGLIKAVGGIPKHLLEAAGDNVEQFDARGAWVTPGIFDMHSHLGVDSVPELRGTADTNSFKGLTLPWLRSLDGVNVFDEAFRLTVSGGVTTSLVLPGSADAIGGQAFVLKLRPTDEGSPSSMVLEPPFSLNKTRPTDPPHWRHMKHATGENPSRTRMDTMWAFRQAYSEAQKLKQAQDEYCMKAELGSWNGLPEHPPNDLKWEALTDVLRGKVKVNIHSYSPSDFDGLVRLSNEFKFHPAAIHHAHHAYLVTPLLEKFYGGKPAVALFATNARYKQEAYRGSEFAPKILNEAGFQVVMKSDHPVLNSRFLLYEAAQAHYYGLPANKAIQAVTTTPAALAGFAHRLGYIQPGYDADIVVWDSHPLSLGATPHQVYIDGIPQITNPVRLEKPRAFQNVPKTPDWEKEAKDAVKYQGLPPLKGSESHSVVFVNIRSIWERDEFGKLTEVLAGPDDGVMYFVDGALVCTSFRAGSVCPSVFPSEVAVVDLEGGSMGPGLVSFGSSLGLVEIQQEWSTNDGIVYGPFDTEFSIVGDLARGVDGLSFEGRDMLLAHRNGVTTSVASPLSRSLIAGLSVAFRNAAGHALEPGAVVQNITALHVTISPGDKKPSLSTQIGLLRQILLSSDESKITGWFRQVASGQLPIVFHVHGADIMAKLLALKAEIEEKTQANLKVAFFGGMEAHILAKEIAAANVGVVVAPVRSFPMSWDARRILPGPPLSRETLISTLVAHNVTVGLGVVEGWEARNARFDLAWAALEAGGRISKGDAIAMGSTNLEKIFGLDSNALHGDWVAYKGGDILDMHSKVVAVASERRRRVELF